MPFALSAWWPIALIVLANLFLNLCSKSVPAQLNPFASLTVTYTVGAVVSALLYHLLNRGGSLLQEYQQLNWSSFVMGLSIIGLEAGSIYLYKAGWPISTGQLVYSSILAVFLLLAGYLLYQEAITPSKVAGMLICLVGLYFLNR